MSIRILIYALSLFPIITLLGVSLFMKDEITSKLLASAALLIAAFMYHHLKNKNFNNYEQF